MLRQRRTAEPLLPQYTNTSSNSRSNDNIRGRRRRRRRQRRGQSTIPPTLLFLMVIIVSLILILLFVGDANDKDYSVWFPPLAVLRYARNYLLEKIQHKSSSFQHYEQMMCNDGTTVGYRNDDYCDCITGEDETETSACAGRMIVAVPHFACHDGSAMVFASRVSDGVQDCADGSDEL